MEASPPQLKLGVLPSPQHTSWKALRDIAAKIDHLGYDSLWCSDHLLVPYPPAPIGPVFESYMVLAGWAGVTERVTLGPMVTANLFRNPALVVKMITTLDHISNGRAILAIGAGWFEEEHLTFGYKFGKPGERLERLSEALQIIRGMLDGIETSGDRFYEHQSVRNLPPPVQRRLPLLVGGGGEKKTLRLVAKYADIWNIAGAPEDVSRKDGILRERCAEIGRDHETIERTCHVGPAFIRDSVDEARTVGEEIFRVHGIEGVTEHLPLVGPPELIADRMRSYIDLGFRHMYFDLISPYDEQTLERMSQEVRTLLSE